MDRNDDWEQKKEGFVEVLKLMDMVNKSKKNPMADIAHLVKDTHDAFIAVGFTHDEAMQLCCSLLSGLGGRMNG